MSEANIKYGAEYRHDGKTWGIAYFAKDQEDAIAKLESLKQGATFLGELVARIPMSHDAGTS